MFGSSLLHDFLACLGLGVACASSIVTMFDIAARIARKTWPVAFKNASTSLIGMLMLGTQFALATFLGETKRLRVDDSVFGFAVGGLVIGVVYFLLKSSKKS